MSIGRLVLNYFIVHVGPCWHVPNELMRRNDQAARVEPQLAPEPRDAVQHFESLGGCLTLFSLFGKDPLKDRGDLIVISQKHCMKIYIYIVFVSYEICITYGMSYIIIRELTQMWNKYETHLIYVCYCLTYDYT